MLPIYKIKRKEVLDLEEVEGLILATEDKRMRCLIALAYTFASRISELMRLKREDFKMKDGRLSVDFVLLKKKANTNMPMLPVWKREINDTYPLVPHIMQHVLSVERGFIFPSSRNGTGHLSRVWAHNQLKELDENLCWHFFRRSVITNVVHEQKSMLAGKQIAGHASITTTERYVERDPQIDEKLANRMY